MSQLIERTLDEAEAARKAEKALVWKIDLLLSAFGEFLQPFLRSPALSRNLGLCLLSARSLFALNWADAENQGDKERRAPAESVS